MSQEYSGAITYSISMVNRVRAFCQASVSVGEYACVRAMLAGDPTASRIAGGRTLVKVRAVDSSGVLDVAFFNQEYRKTSLHKGETYIFYGKVEGDFPRRRMTADVAAKAVEMLNSLYNNSYLTNTHSNEAAQSCLACHGNEGKLKNTAGKMDCNSCHDESLGHKVFSDVHYRLLKEKP